MRRGCVTLRRREPESRTGTERWSDSGIACYVAKYIGPSLSNLVRTPTIEATQRTSPESRGMAPQCGFI